MGSTGETSPPTTEPVLLDEVVPPILLGGWEDVVGEKGKGDCREAGEEVLGVVDDERGAC